MKTTGRIAAFVCLLVLMSGAIVTAQDEGEENGGGPFSFKRQRKPPISGSVSDAPTSGWKWPRLWPGKATNNSTAQRRPAQQSTWQKFNSGTKNFISQTADTLNPFNDANDNPPPARVTGSSGMFSQAANSRTRETKSKSFLPSWPWSAEPPKQEPRTVTEFLMQDRPDF